MTNPQKHNRIKENGLSHSQLLKIISYDEETGVFTWRLRPEGPVSWNTRYAGKAAGNISEIRNTGKFRTRITISSRFYFAHRLAWFYTTGVWPTELIDHINCDGTDNRFINLRQASNGQNLYNQGPQKHNTSGFKGVFWASWANSWRAVIRVSGRAIHLGYFKSKLEAARSYEDASIKYHGEFGRLHHGARAWVKPHPHRARP